ncbi:hypothetical protein ACFV3E_22640 [Streptomyces sp. NPDC059718]
MLHWTIKILRDEQAAGRTPADLDPVSATRIIVTGGERALTDQVTNTHLVARRLPPPHELVPTGPAQPVDGTRVGNGGL